MHVTLMVSEISIPADATKAEIWTTRWQAMNAYVRGTELIDLGVLRKMLLL